MVNRAYGAQSIWRNLALRRVFVGLRDLVSEDGGSQSGQGSSEAPGQSVPCRVRFAPLLRMSILHIQDQTRMNCRLPKERVARTFWVCRLQLLDPSEWKLVAYGGFIRDENIIVLEARSFFVCCQLCRDLFSAWTPLESFLTTLRWCWRSASDAQICLHCCQSCVRPLRLASGQVLSYRSGGYRQS